MSVASVAASPTQMINAFLFQMVIVDVNVPQANM